MKNYRIINGIYIDMDAVMAIIHPRKKSLQEILDEYTKQIEEKCKLKIKDEMIYNKIYKSPSKRGINGLYPATSELFKPSV